MKVLDFGSLNIDNVYRVKHIVRPGETIAADSHVVFAGGKGLNQSIALARAGVKVFHAGMIGGDGMFLKELLEADGVDCRFLRVAENVASGSAWIQVADDGENSIVLSGGANRAIAAEMVNGVLDNFECGDIVLLQNEISVTAEVIRAAALRRLKVFFNPAPMSDEVAEMPLELVDTLIVNETELDGLKKHFANFDFCNLLLTQGGKGAVYYPANGGEEIFVPACKVDRVVDTTGAGDTFIGYFTAGVCRGLSIKCSLEQAAAAAAVAVTRPGAAVSIPAIGELNFGS